MTSQSTITAADSTERGQALVEFILFLPFMLMMYTVVVGLGDAIYGSINQQKAVRAYFFFRMQNNPQVTRPQRSGGQLVNDSWTSFGQTFIGWADYLQDNRPVLPCYRLNLPFAPAAGDTCEEAYSNVTTQFIRVGTVFGMCGATMQRDSTSGQFVEMPAGENSPNILDTILFESSCQIR